MGKLTGNSTKSAKCKPRGKPFPKGVSGNPSGRKPIPQEFKELAEQYSLPALKKAIEIIQDDDTRTADKLRAIEIILDRGIGKPIQTVDIGNKDGETFKTANIDFSKFTIEELRELIENED